MRRPPICGVVPSPPLFPSRMRRGKTRTLDLMHTHASRYLLCLVLISLPTYGNTQASKDSTTDLAKQFVRLLRYEKQMEAYREQCANTAKSVSPESLVKDNPRKFG